jgi:hypothetical protein
MDKKDVILVGLFVMCVILFILVVSTTVKYLIRKNCANDYFHPESNLNPNSEFNDSEFQNRYSSMLNRKPPATPIWEINGKESDTPNAASAKKNQEEKNSEF